MVNFLTMYYIIYYEHILSLLPKLNFSDIIFSMIAPKQRHTKSRRDKRRSQLGLKKLNLVPCPNCHTLIFPHQVCPNCGYYKGKEIIDVLKKLTKKERKEREKEIKREKTEKAK